MHGELKSGEHWGLGAQSMCVPPRAADLLSEVLQDLRLWPERTYRALGHPDPVQGRCAISFHCRGTLFDAQRRTQAGHDERG